MPRPAGETFSLAAGLIKCSLFTIVRDESGILNCAAIATREGRVIFLCVSKLGRCIPSRLTDEAAPLQLCLRIGPSRRTFRRPLCAVAAKAGPHHGGGNGGI
jgi:hypothetical protein